MAGAIDKKINETRGEIENSPQTYLDGRSGILDDVALVREFAHTRLNGLCKGFPVTGTNGTSATHTLAQICENHAKVRAICFGAKDSLSSIRQFTFPSHETVNGALTITEPNTSVFGVKTMDITEDNVITLSNTATATQTIGTNSFSTYVGDYYLIRSRVDGELVDISKNSAPYATPNPDVPFGNTITWGSSVSGEEAANTWNYHWATANIAGIETFNSGAWNEITKLTMSQSLTQGSNTDYTPVGPSFKQKYYLKRKADAVNTFTITATTTTDSVVLTSVSESDIAKVKHGDVITGTGIPTSSDGTPAKILAVKSAEKTIRINDITQSTGTVGQSGNVVTLSGATFPEGIQGKTITISGGGGNVVSRDSTTEITIDNSASVSTGTSYSLSHSAKATANGTVTVTVNSVPFGHAKDDIFCQIEVVAEGLVKNDDWKPIGDDDGLYNAANEGEDEQLVANTSQFIGLLGFFDPDNGGSPNNDLTKSARADYTSSGKEFSGTLYPNIEVNPMKPAVGGTNKAYETESGEIVGTQPTGQNDKSLHIGRYVRWDAKRDDENGALPEYRYVTDSAEKWFYEMRQTDGYTGGTETVATIAMPNADEPRAECPRTLMTSIKSTINGATSIDFPSYNGGGNAALAYPQTAGVVWNSGYNPFPADGDTSPPTLTSGVTSSGSPATYSWATAPPTVTSGSQYGQSVIATFYTLTNNYIIANELYYNALTYNPSSCSSGAAAGCSWTATTAVRRTVYNCSYNFVQRMMYNEGDSGTSFSNTNFKFIDDSLKELKNYTQYRDGLIAAGTAQAGGSGISDTDFDNVIRAINTNDRNVWQQSADVMHDYLNTTRTTLTNQNRTGNNNSNSNKGSSIDFQSIGNPRWNALMANNTTILSNFDKRIAEVDARIGKPTRSGTPAVARNNPPAVRVSAIPASNTTNGYAPYGRTLYNECNHLLGSDLNLLGNLIKDIQSLTDLIDLVKKARNRYELLSGRDKEYTDV